MIEQGQFIQEDKPVYYIYELTMNGRVQTGIVACASVDDYQKQVIKKHENIVLVLSGHISSENIIVTKTEGENGNKEILS